jgi:predicted MFS family arabinose efflux permease
MQPRWRGHRTRAQAAPGDRVASTLVQAAFNLGNASGAFAAGVALSDGFA